MYDYKLIEAFAKVIQERGFEKAASVLHITQSAISQRVKQLEEQIGQILLLRTTPPVPTETGKRVLKLYNQVRHLEQDLSVSIEPEDTNEYTALPLAVNADSIDTWFFDAIQPFLDRENAILDLFVDDQERTHRFLRDGKVLACISSRQTAIQGCSIEKIGDVVYGLYCSKPFADKWFPNGLTFEALQTAPAICFTRDDELNIKIFKQLYSQIPKGMPLHYVPSSVMFISMLKNGTAYGVLPDQQSRELAASGEIIDLAPDHKINVRLYWHYWNLKSRLLQDLTRELLTGFKRLL